VLVRLSAAAQNVVPVAVTAAESVEQLRTWASGRCLSADSPGSASSSGCGISGGKSVWWTWMAPSSGSVQIDTIGSSFDTTLGLNQPLFASQLHGSGIILRAGLFLRISARSVPVIR